MNLTKQITSIIIGMLPFFMNGQNSYSQKREYGFNGKVKKVTSYMVHVSKYQIPVDTLDYFGKSTINFNEKGDVITYHRMYDLPNYQFKSSAVYSGTGKNISYKETSKLNDESAKVINYKFIWTDALNYKIESTSETADLRFITLNTDFTIDKVVFKIDGYQSEEKASYHYNNENQLEKIVYKVISTENDITTVKDDVRIIQSVDVFNNATVIYFYEKESARVPKSVLFRYYEYY